MMSDRYSDLPESVRTQIARGQVPPPRQTGDPEDPIPDLKVSIAIAEARGDFDAVGALQAKWLDLSRRGVESTWQPPKPGDNEDVFGSASRDDLLKRAHAAAENGDDDKAHRLRVRAMHAPTGDAAEALKAASEAERNASIGGDKSTYAGDVMRRNTEALHKLRGEPDPLPAPSLPAQPQTPQEFNAAIAEADAAGDTRRSDALRTGLLNLHRQRAEAAVPPA